LLLYTHRHSASACPSKLRCTGVKRRAGRAQALETARANDLLFWASRYNLFVLWSADRTHPWDALPGAAAHTTLEIGKLRGSERDVRGPARPAIPNSVKLNRSQQKHTDPI